jgi:geranylgeranyl diphosphate synthase type II
MNKNKIPLSLAEAQIEIEKIFAELNWNIEPKHLYAPIEYILDLGGKRIRPLLCLIASSMYGNWTESKNAAIGIEIFHNFTLLHDDIMDKAPIRRGKATVHEVWDENTAILSGDAMLIKAYQFIAQTKKEKLPSVLDLFSQTAIEVCEGQEFDMSFETRNDVNEQEYIHMIRLKTAVLLAASLKIGAIIGGANDDEANELYNFAIFLGLAFQLKDDFLDVYGNPETFGKRIGGDILCNKKTYMLINAIKLANAEQKKQLEYWLSIDNFDENEKINSVTKLYSEIGIDNLCKEKINEYQNLAMQSLKKIKNADTSVLETIANKLLNRKS